MWGKRPGVPVECHVAVQGRNSQTVCYEEGKFWEVSYRPVPLGPDSRQKKGGIRSWERSTAAEGGCEVTLRSADTPRLDHVKFYVFIKL